MSNPPFRKRISAFYFAVRFGFTSHHPCLLLYAKPLPAAQRKERLTERKERKISLS
jgi:hypothetical protein